MKCECGQLGRTQLAAMILETSRLLIRPLNDADFPAYREFIAATAKAVNQAPPELLFEWYKTGAAAQAILYQPPYGDRACLLKSTNEFIGAVGLVPCLDFFGMIPELGIRDAANVKTPEVGIFYAIHPDHRKKGYASEAVSALIHYAFESLNLRRVIATTSQDNLASQSVMRKTGMRICKNPSAGPDWLQIVAFIENPSTV
jgi:ribosomal-protein-alanine N-acetyltransferase